jgi:tetratricopeptide (TPR) repeat protein
MNLKKIVAIGLLIVLVNSCALFKHEGKKSAPITKANFPYIEKFHEGLRLKQKGEFDDAILALNYCLGVRKDDDAVYYALSEIYIQKNDLMKSADAIQKASLIDPKNTWYLQELAYMNFEQKKYTESVKCFEQLVKSAPQNVDWLYGYAESLVRTGKTEDAIKAFDKTEEQIGVIPELAIQKFRLYIELKKPEKGVEEILKARKIHPEDAQLIGVLVDYYFQTKQDVKAVATLEEMAKADPTNGRVHLGLADIYKQKGKTADYYTELFRAFACEDVDLDSKMKILIDIHENNSKLTKDDFQLADILVAQYPNDSKSFSIQGDFYLKVEDQINALKSYKKALQFEQSKFPIWNQVLVMEYQNTDFENLYLDSKKCLEYFPNNTNVYLFNGISANQLKKHQEAIDNLEIGKELIVNDQTLKAEFYAQIGEAYFGLKNNSEGKKNYDTALELDKNSTLNMNNFAYRLALAKLDLTRAEELIKLANEKSPGQPHFIDTYGWVLFQKGEYSKAMEQFLKAYEVNPNDKIIIEHLGDGYFKAGKVSKAVEYWKKALELESTNKNLKLKIEKQEYYEPIY